MSKQSDAIRERLERMIETVSANCYHRANTEFYLPTSPKSYNAKGWPDAPDARWSSPFEPSEVEEYMRAQIDYIITGVLPCPSQVR